MRTSTTSSRRLLTSRKVVLPVVAVGLLGLAPWQAAGLFHRWQAMAQSASPPPASSQPTSAPSQPPAIPIAAGPAAGPVETPAARVADSGPGPTPADGKLLEELNRRSAELDRREQDLRTWAAQIAAAERLARAQIAELGQLRTDLEKEVTQESAASDQDIAVLVGLYSNMKPAQAATLLGRLDAPKAAAILEKLDIHSAGPALAAMDPTAAVAITEELSRRHAPLRR